MSNPSAIRDPLLRRADELAHQRPCPDLGRWIDTAYYGTPEEIRAVEAEMDEYSRPQVP